MRRAELRSELKIGPVFVHLCAVDVSVPAVIFITALFSVYDARLYIAIISSDDIFTRKSGGYLSSSA